MADRRPMKRPRSEDDDASASEAVASDEDDDDSPEELLQRLHAYAQSQGIPIDYLMHCMQTEDGNEEDQAGAAYPEHPLRNLQDVANFIPDCRKILVLAGAGMSVASGIPDFRSPNIGLYNTLNAELLTATPEQKALIANDPSFALDYHLFLENPLPCLELHREFILGVRDEKWKPTLAHWFLRHLGDKLCRIYTQNIDGLEDHVMIPQDTIIPVHGCMDRAECAVCRHSMNFDDFCAQVETNIKDITKPDAKFQSSRPIHCEKCHKPTMKPSIVLFRSSLPKAFFENVTTDTKDVDLLLIVGTSLRVAPANTIVYRVPRSCHRVLINKTMEGQHLGMEFMDDDDDDHPKRDFFAKGDIETTVLELMVLLGWTKELEELLEQDKLPEATAELVREKLLGVEKKSTSEGD